MAGTISRGYTFGSTETVTNAKLHALVDDASISGIIDSDIAADANIASSKINFNLSDYVTLAGAQTITGAKTFDTTTVFNTPLANTNIAAITQASKVAGSSFYALASCISSAGKLPLANIPTIDSLLPSQTGNDGKFLTTNGSAASWGSVAVVPVYVADAGSSIAFAETERAGGNGSYEKVKEITLYGSGSLNVSFEIKGPTSGTQYGRIYKNGSAVGTERFVNNSAVYVTYEETLSGLVNGDKIQLYAKWITNEGKVKNFKLLGSQSTIDIN